jgi:hypothetical protein
MPPKTETDIGKATVKIIRQGIRAGKGAIKSATSFISSIEFPSPKLLSLAPSDRK